MTFKRFIVPCMLFLLAACQPATPIAIYVTPTPESAVTSESQARLTSASEAQSITALTTPIATVGPIVQTFTPAPPLATQPAPTPEGIQLSEGDLRPTVTFMGPIIGPEYTLPPTDTPRPTNTPTLTQTATEGPSPTPTITVTPLPGQPTPLPDLNRDLMGIQLDPNLSVEDWNEAIRRLQENLTVGWIKVQVSWKALQPNAPDEFGEPFQRLELFLQDADRRGFKILVSVAKAPNWARSNTTEDGPPDDPQRLADFMSFMLTRFGASIDAVEVWNEPNLIREWQGVLPKGGGGYMTLFAPSYQAIRNYSSSIMVVTAGLAPTGDNAGQSVDDRSFLRQMYAAGLANYKDVAIGAHPYSWANSPDATCCGTEGWDDDPHFFFADNMRDYRQIMDQNGHSGSHLWVTEFGWATWDGLPGDAPEVWMARTDQWEQANYTIRAFQIGQQTPNVGPMILWNLNFALLAGKIENRDERAAYSLILPPPMPERPLYWMLYDAIRPDQTLDFSH